MRDYSGYPVEYTLSRGKRLLTGALAGLLIGGALGYAVGITQQTDATRWPARFECRDLSGATPTAVRVCTPLTGWRENGS